MGPSVSVSLDMNEDEPEQQQAQINELPRHWIYDFIDAKPLQILYLGMLMNGIPFYCFFATFGAFVQTTFDLNPQQLGVITLTITAGEITALVSSSIISKFKSNMFIVLMGSWSGVVVFVVFLILMKCNLLSLISVVAVLYFFTLTIELSYLNSIVCTLHFAPTGHEATASMIGQFVSRSSSILSVILGTHIVEWKGFSFLIEMLIICQFISL
eukprot:273130_1